MAKVIKVFRERMHGMKRYNVDDEYPETDTARVTFLAKLGYVEMPKPKPTRRKKGADTDVDTGR